MARVFISHRGADSAAAQQLKSDLEARGHEVRLDVADIHIGDSIPEWMNAGLRDAEAVVLCYSSSGVETPWMGREWLSTLARQLEGAKILLLPVRLTGGQPPPILADIKYAD